MNMDSIEICFVLVTRKWLTDAAQIESDLSLIIRPILDFIHVESQVEEPRKTSPMPQSADPPKPEHNPNMLSLKPNQCFILNHPPFGRDYQKYIRKSLSPCLRSVSKDFSRRQLAHFRANRWIRHFGSQYACSERISSFHQYVHSKVYYSRSE